MRKLTFNLLLTGLLLLGLPSAWGFSLAGPPSADAFWQTVDKGYGPANFDPVYPKDYAESYRLNTPVFYYACDASLLDYYGQAAVTNVDAAFAILNGVFCGQTNSPVFLQSPTNGYFVTASGVPTGAKFVLTAANNLDIYSTNLAEFATRSREKNLTAEAAGVIDLKSAVLQTALSVLGLEDPTRYVYTLHDRYPTYGVNNPQCPQDYRYVVVQRNFDGTARQSTPYANYINDSPYGYQIVDLCGPGNNRAWTAETANSVLDGSGNSYTPVMTGGISLWSLFPGDYYTGLTRDDVAGLRFLMSSNSIHWEAATDNEVQLLTTNVGVPTPVSTMSLAALISAATHNSPAQLQALFPGLIVTGLSTNYGIGWVTNYTSYYTNFPGTQYGTPPQLVTVAVPAQVPVTNYLNVFLNVVTNHYYPNSIQATLTTTVAAPYGSQYGTAVVTNTEVSSAVAGNLPGGDFYVIPGSLTGYAPLGITNSAVTNAVISTSISTNSSGIVTTVSTINYWTNYTLWFSPLTVARSAAAPALRQGIGRLQFIRMDTDSLLDQTFQRMTNTYQIVKIVNGQRVVETFERVVTQPDFKVSASDLVIPAPARGWPYGQFMQANQPANFNISAINTALAGPGTINLGIQNMVLNKSMNGSMYINGSMNSVNNALGFGLYNTNGPAPVWLNQGSQIAVNAWGAFDESTNWPTLYGSSGGIDNLLSQIFVQVSPATLPDGTNGVAYTTVHFSVSGGQPPYIWSASNTGVPGLTFNANPADPTLLGIPTSAGSFLLTLQLIDSGNRKVTRTIPITIH